MGIVGVYILTSSETAEKYVLQELPPLLWPKKTQKTRDVISGNHQRRERPAAGSETANSLNSSSVMRVLIH